MFLSVVVPTRNRASVLRSNLDALLKQTYPVADFEVIVADNGSTNDTADVCAEFTDSLPNFQYVPVPQPGLHNGRHAGWKHARGNILVFCDDDICAHPTWLQGVSEGFEIPNVALVGGKSLPWFEAAPPDWFDTLKATSEDGWWIGPYSLIDLGDEVREIAPRLVFGCNYSIRRSVLEQIGGFHPDGMPTEQSRFRGDGESAVSEAIRSRGLKALYHPAASVSHLVSNARLTTDYLHWRAYLQGISDSYTRIRRAGGISAIQRLRDFIRRESARLVAQAKQVRYQADPIGRLRANAYWEGYAYHQREVRADPALLQWVLKPTYLDDNP